MKKNLLLGLAILLLIFGVTGIANATLVGDTIYVEHYYPDLATQVGGIGTILSVTDDDSDAIDYLSNIYDINSSSILIDFVADRTWLTASFNGVVITSINDSSGNDLTNVSVETNLEGWDLSRLSFTGDSIAFNWQGLHSADDGSSYLNASLEFGSQPVPEPTSMLLLGLGLVGLAGVRKKFIKK